MTITWEIQDGYFGGSRPQSFELDDYDILYCDDISELEDLFWEAIQEDFEQKVSPISEDLNNVIEFWKNERENFLKEETEANKW